MVEDMQMTMYKSLCNPQAVQRRVQDFLNFDLQRQRQRQQRKTATTCLPLPQ